jgi:uncharacterized protein (TIGR03437 family)
MKLRQACARVVVAACFAGSALAQGTGWFDDFESYPNGRFPSPNWSYSGNSDIRIDNSVRVSGNQSVRLFGLLGACWGALLHRPLNVSPPFTLELYVRNGSERLGGCHPDRAGVALATEPSWERPSRDLLSFDASGGTKIGSTTYPYQLNEWIRVKLSYERLGTSTVRMGYWINGELKGIESASALSYENDLSHLSLWASEGSAWYDDVRVTPGVPQGLPPNITTPSPLPGGLLGVAYSQTLVVSGGVAPYAWSVTAGSLPPGLGLDAASGRISGTPGALGLYSFSVQVSDSARATGSQSFSLSIDGRTCTAEPTDMLIAPGDLIVCEIAPVGDTDLFRFSGVSGELVYVQAARQSGPGKGCVRLVAPDGTMSEWGCPELFARLTKTGTHTIQVADDSHDHTLTYALTLERLAPPSSNAIPVPFGQRIESDISPVGDMDLYYFRGAAGDTVNVLMVRLSGSGKPCFVLVDPDGGIIGGEWACGIPNAERDAKLTKAGLYAIMLGDENSDETLSYRLEVQCFGTCQAVGPALAITSASPLPSGVAGTGYSQVLVAAGGTPPYRWSVTGGTLPPGLSLNASTGALSGTPSSAGTFTFSVQVTDSAGATAIKSFSLTISGATLSVGRSALLFTYLMGDPPPAAQMVSLSSSGSSVSFTAAASTSSGGNWLLVNPPSGTTPATLSVLVNPAGLGVGIYSGTVTVTASGATNSPQRVEVQLFVNRPEGPPQVFSLVNGASMKGGAVAPGEVVTFFGSNLGPASLMNLQLNEAGQVATALGEVQVTFDNIPAPLLYVQASQLSAIVPYAVAGTTQAKVEVRYKGTKSNTVVAQVAASAPGVFTIDSSGQGQGAILNQNYTVNSAANPAEKGSVVMVYATGEGETDPQVADGRFTSPEALPKPKLPVSVKIGGLDAEVLYAGGAPGSVAGLLQVNVQVPASVATGNAVPVVLTIGGKSSQEEVTMAVR